MFKISSKTESADSSLKKKVFVGLSGGVDSSVSALLLQKAGYEVTGVFIKVWQPENGDCTWKEDRRDAMRVAAHLGIKFKTLDLRGEYKKGVVDYMISEYLKGRTPNPDVMCNREVKFGGFMKWALENGADFVATGHYAETNKGELFEGLDVEKDQSYFLWTLNNTQLNKILFPIGHLEKRDVRKIAEEYNLPVAKKKDSQGVCFIGHIDMKDFIRQQINDSNVPGLKEGDVLNILGEVIGRHDGSLLYTIGERHGFNLSNNSSSSPRLYVVDKNIKENTITVADKMEIRDGVGLISTLSFDDIHFISDDYKKLLPVNCLARSRYRQKKEKCILSFVNNKYEINFMNPQEGITPGQSLVLYFENDSMFTKNNEGPKKTLGGVII